MSEDDSDGSLWGHVEELRQTLIRVLVTIVGATILCFVFYQQILAFLTLPLSWQAQPAATSYQVIRERVVNQGHSSLAYALPADRSLIASDSTKELSTGYYELSPGGWLEVEWLKARDQLVLLGPIDGFRVVLQASFWFALVVSSPLWLYFMFQFVAPGLRVSERSLAFPVVTFCLLFMTLGALFGFFVTIPIANQTLYAFNNEIGINLWTLSHYLDFTLLLLFANALAFELCALLLLLVYFQVVDAEWLSEKRRYMIVAIFILSALLTPPDVITQLLVALPLCAMYELVVVYAKQRRGYLARTCSRSR